MPTISAPKGQPEKGSIETLPSGALRVRVYACMDPVTGLPHYLRETVSAGPHAWNKAKKVARRLAHQVDEGRHPRTDATLTELLNRHFPMLDCAETTRRTNERHRRKHIEPVLGKHKIAKIDAAIIESFYTELRTCRDHCKRHKHIRQDKKHVCKPLGNSTILKIHGILSKAFSRAERWDWIVQNPVKKAEAPSKPEPDPQPPSPNEAAMILNESWKDVSWGTLVWVAMTTSPRRGELCAPRWSHFDADRKTLTYKRSIAQDGKELWETDTKTHRKRIVALDEDTTAILSDYKAHCQRMARLAGTHLSEDAYIFSNVPDGTVPLKPASVSQRYRRLARRLGIESTIHKLRHYTATELITAGVDIRTVAGRLGHSAGGTTTLKMYAAWVSEADQRASTILHGRMPPRPAGQVSTIERAKDDPQAPFEIIAASIRRDINAGKLCHGEVLPSVNETAAEHKVSVGTAHRAHGLLRSWGLVTEGGRGTRPTVVAPETSGDSTVLKAMEVNTSEPRGNSSNETLLELRLLSLGVPVKDFSTQANSTDAPTLHRLLNGAARRHGGSEYQIENYELEVRQGGALVTTFVAL